MLRSMSTHPGSLAARDAVVLGVIGGSGLYAMDALQDAESVTVTTPFGDPSGPYTVGVLERPGKAPLRSVFLPRHGRGHRIPPSELNYRANIDCLKRAGVTEILSLSACGSFKEELPPGAFVIVDQFIDRFI